MPIIADLYALSKVARTSIYSQRHTGNAWTAVVKPRFDSRPPNLTCPTQTLALSVLTVTQELNANSRGYTTVVQVLPVKIFITGHIRWSMYLRSHH
jgi:hypothetical protein